MKLSRFLLVNNEPVSVIDEQITLNLNTPGSATFLINNNQTPVKKSAIISFNIQYNQQETAQRLFFGFVDKITDIDNTRQKLFCREFSAVLNEKLPLNLRHVSATDVLNEITSKTFLKFTLPEAQYSHWRTANFYNLGNGYQAMDAIGRVFKIPDFIWQQQGFGMVYVGSWADSRWKNKNIELPQNWFDKQTANNSAVMPAVPALRPGAVVNNNRIKQLVFSKNKMTISW